MRNWDHLSKEGWYGDPEVVRSTKEMLVRSFAIQLVVTASYGHLLSLRNISNKASALLLLYVLGTVFFPTLPLAQLLRHFRSAIARACRDGTLVNRMRFNVSACLGMYGTVSHHDEETKPILNFEFPRLRQTRRHYNILWIGRMFVLVALLAQLCGTIVLWVRRSYLYGGYYRLWGFD